MHYHARIRLGQPVGKSIEEVAIRPKEVLRASNQKVNNTAKISLPGPDCFEVRAAELEVCVALEKTRSAHIELLMPPHCSMLAKNRVCQECEV